MMRKKRIYTHSSGLPAGVFVYNDFSAVIWCGRGFFCKKLGGDRVPVENLELFPEEWQSTNDRGCRRSLSTGAWENCTEAGAFFRISLCRSSFLQSGITVVEGKGLEWQNCDRNAAIAVGIFGRNSSVLRARQICGSEGCCDWLCRWNYRYGDHWNGICNEKI